MKERPILMSAPMVRAILAGAKIQTRRVVKYAAQDLIDADGWPLSDDSENGAGEVRAACPYGQPGDRLWVKETFQWFSEDGEVLYKADPKDDAEMRELKFDGCLEAFWRPSIFMPRRLSRITLEITDIRVERLQEISIDDAYSEGTAEWAAETQRNGNKWSNIVRAYQGLWESINGAGSWDANPFVWVVSFRRVNAG